MKEKRPRKRAFSFWLHIALCLSFSRRREKVAKADEGAAVPIAETNRREYEHCRSVALTAPLSR
jgi:hypothetical protein